MSLSVKQRLSLDCLFLKDVIVGWLMVVMVMIVVMVVEILIMVENSDNTRK